MPSYKVPEKSAFDSEGAQPASKSEAARFNAFTLKKLQAAIKKDPEINLAEQFPMGYQERLMAKKTEIERPPKKSKAQLEAEEDIRLSLRPSDPAEIVFPLSDAVANLLAPSQTAGSANGLSQRLIEILASSEIIWKAPFAGQKSVFKCSADIVIKAIRNMEDYTEYTALQYLERHTSNIPVPRPLGLVRMGRYSLLFMSYMQSVPLGDVWQTLDSCQKSSLSKQLNSILEDLRTLPYTEGTPLGGVGGEGCKDLRRHVRVSETTITSLEEFETFMYSSPHPGGGVFVKFLRRLSPSTNGHSGPRIVFTHGDIRPDNIMVELVDNNYMVSGILDWEYSGFYPDYIESVRCTNCLSPYEEDDWFLYLPECVSPDIYAQWWLLDRVRETRVV
ncbi:uncharacterized protein N7515_000669 [Penicillium bovifimosum]|uniref:Aminoglycoside phosphotransferase domain-containing protein n=1 Tax=Penicillium bovifimosum TaxID=126998 RepID=A0A9W9HFT4_9EURO|nr:uncharacterized protein N7515_000669 [Penicillium bovifimosum]KAJ5146105.1 hypothetical protein N7515_000669 [Penicillium bovifimosum]